MISPVIVAAKAVAGLSRLLGKGSGSAAPGLLVERFRPQLMRTQLAKLPEGVIVVTGTNGKTTTTKMVVQMLEDSGKKVLTNRSGSNFTRGILSLLARESSITGVLDFDIGVLELDEAYTPLIAAQISPKLLLALNVHRDQMDRYGEIDKTARLIGEAMQHCERVVVNADDPLLVAQAQALKHAQVHYFGLDSQLRAELPTDDQLHTSSVKVRSVPTATTLLIQAKPMQDQQELSFLVDELRYETVFNLSGLHNAANATAALAVLRHAMPRTKVRNMVGLLAGVRPAFGRGESFDVQGKKVLFGLVKNPSGFNQNLKTMLSESVSAVIIAINDDYADGRDVSWLWDVHFAQYRTNLQQVKIYATGIRAHDMALRLQQENIDVHVVNNNLKETLYLALEQTTTDKKVVIFPTYTAMLQLRAAIGGHVSIGDIHD